VRQASTTYTSVISIPILVDPARWYGSIAMDRPDRLHFTEDDEANRLLATDGLALLIGMLLDQQFPMERAFYGPQLLKDRLGEDLDERRLAAWDPEDLARTFQGPPAVHRYWGAMAQRTQALCQVLVDEYDGRAENLWETAADARELLKRLKALPGFGEAKSRIFVGVLGRRLGVRPEGWEEAAADWPSVADVATFSDILVLRDQKKAMKEARKG
jgi:uncharacterized HhH-GPD family protein